MSNPVRIPYIIDTLRHGGAALQLMCLIARLGRRRFRPHLVTLRDH